MWTAAERTAAAGAALKTSPLAMQKLLAFAYLGRINMAPLTMSVPVLGALTGDNPSHLVRLMLVGLAAHLFGFALNDLIDLPLDRNVRPQHPLITGRLQTREAWIGVALLPVLALALYPGKWIGLLIASLLLSLIYNRWSKWGSLPRLLAELALAASIGLLCLSGADHLDSKAMLFSAVLAAVLLLINSVPSGLKDLKTDADYGARSFVLAMGCAMLDADQMLIPPRMKIYTTALNSVIVAGILVLLITYRPITAVLSVILLIFGALHLRRVLNLTTFSAVRRSLPLLNGYFNYTALALVLIDQMPILLQLAYGWLALLLVLVPLQIGMRLWRQRYEWA